MVSHCPTTYIREWRHNRHLSLRDLAKQINANRAAPKRWDKNPGKDSDFKGPGGKLASPRGAE